MDSRILLAALLAATIGYFLFLLAMRLRGFRKARPKLPFDRILSRLWRVFAEVFLQTRVIRERPVAGFAHALVMWGFFAFAWVTVRHILEGFRGLETAHPDAGWYGGFAAAWAVAVLAGILWLSYRRFVVRPEVLDAKVSWSSAAVAFLIVVLMATYLAGWRGFEPGSEPWRINWWAHTAALCGMFLVIPNSKHLHLVLGPAAIFFRDGATTSAMRPLREDDDDDFGMLTFGDLSQKDLLDVNSCVECGRCTEACPANVVGGSLNPKEVILQMQRGLLAGGDKVAGTDQEVDGGKAWVTEEDLYQCLSCGACEEACPVGIEHVGLKILDLRRGLVSEGRTHKDKVADLFTTMERAPHNPWGVAQDTRRKLIEGDGFPIFDGNQEWLLWLGCGASYDPHGQNVARAMKKILDAAGVSWGVLARETCCGEPARRAGNEYLYMELSGKVIESLRGSKARNLVTCDPHCTRMLDVDYRQDPAFEQMGIRVVHHTELLAELAPKLSLQPKIDRVTFHDPCYLSRGRGITSEPRELLDLCGVDVIEMKHNRERTFCCGAGGAQLFIAEDQPDSPTGRVNHKRFAEAAETGVKKVAVACPYCPIMLNDAAQHAGREDLEVVDVAEMMARRLPG